jgi:hypothetical protein
LLYFIVLVIGIGVEYGTTIFTVFIYEFVPFLVIHHWMKIGCIYVVIYVAIAVRNAGVLGGKAPFPINNEFIAKLNKFY